MSETIQLGDVSISKGAKPLPMGPWRAHLKANWAAASAGFAPYNAAVMHATYGPLTGLPPNAFW